MATWVVVWALLAGVGPGRVVVEKWPACDLCSVTVLMGVRSDFIPKRLQGITAVYAELLLMNLNEAMAEGKGAAAELLHLLPESRGIELTHRRDYLALAVNTTSAGAAVGLKFMMQRLLAPNFSAEKVNQAKKLVLKRRDAWVSSVIEPTEELLVRAIWTGRVGDVMYGSPEAIKSVLPRDLERFHEQLMRRGNVWVSVVGAVEDETEIRKVAEELLGELPPGGQGKPSPGLAAGRRVVVDDNPAIQRASLAVGGPLPAFGTAGYWAGRIVREMLDGPRGRLYEDRTLAARLGLIIPSSLGWRDWPLRPLPVQVSVAPYLAVHVICHPSRIEIARKGIIRHLTAIAQGDFSDEDLERARTRVANGWARGIASPSMRSRMIAVTSMLGSELLDADEVWEKVRQVDKKAVQQLATQVVERLAVGLQMPRP